ncbi:hypothetical protein EJB05_03328, partial [Eragrostis curvula]
MASLADSFLADLDELSDNEAYPEEENAEAAGMEEDGEDVMPDLEFLNYDDLDSVSKLQKTRRKLTPRQKKKVKETGLDSLLCVPRMPIQRMLLELIAEKYNVDELSFTLGDHVVPISTWDVYCILGLVDRGHEVVQNRGRPDMGFFNMFRGKGDTSITLKHLEAEIASGVADDHFARVFVLYAIGTILAPSSKESVSSGYLEIDDRSKGLPGNLALLQVWYFEHFQADGDCFDYAKHEHPLIKNWSTAKVKKRALLDGIKKFGAEKIYKEDTEGVNVEFSKYMECSDQDEKEEINLEGLHKAEQSDECHRKKVKTRRDRQPSKNCRSPYEGIKQKNVCGTKIDGHHIDNITKGLHLSAVELAAIKYVGQELVQNKDKVLVQMGTPSDMSEMNGTIMRCLIRPVRENGMDKWLDSEIIGSYAHMCNSVWGSEPKQKKHAISDYRSQWLRGIGSGWIHPREKVTDYMYTFCQKFVGSDLVFIPMNTHNNHWWLCVLCPEKRQVQILDPMRRSINYKETIRPLRSGINFILKAVENSTFKLESTWSDHDVLDWDVIFIENIPRQKDICSCGLFTIKFMQYWNGTRLTCNFSQADMEAFRKKMPADLIFSALNEVSSTKKAILDMVNA